MQQPTVVESTTTTIENPPPEPSPMRRKWDKLLPELKKTEKKTVVSHSQLEEMKKKQGGKLRLSDVVPFLRSPSLLPRTEEQPPIGTWPLELVLVRHGQSEGNEATARSEKGDLSCYTDEFRNKHSSTYRLTDKGIQQAKFTGQWIKENIGEKFDRYYTSEYVRAMETAALLDLPDANWFTEIVLRERDKGQMDNTSAVDKKTVFKEEMERRKRDAFFWSPPSGESLAQVCIRIDHTLNTLRRDCSNKRVLIVCHGEVMWAFRVRIERLSQIRFHQLSNSKDPKDQMHNTQVLHYTRINPQTGDISPEFKFLRSSCPWRPEYSTDEWVEFNRPTYTNEELKQSVSTVPRYVNNTDRDDADDKVNY